MKILGTLLALATLGSVPLAAQQELRARLESRGLPADLVQQVTAIAAEATAHGLPSAPLGDKAIEGFAKQVPAPRIVAVVRQYGARMVDARSAVQGAGVSEPGGGLITAATDALGRGFAPAEISRVVRAAPQSNLAAPGLTVAAALAAQGMPTQVAADVVAQAMEGGSTAAQILDLPSVARAMQSGGMTPDDAGREMLRGGRSGDSGRQGGSRPDGGGRQGGVDGHGGPGSDGRPATPGSGPPPPRPGSGRGPGSGRPGDGGGGDHGGRPARP